MRREEIDAGRASLSRPPSERRVAKRFAIGFRAFGASAKVGGSLVQGVNISQTGMLVRLLEPPPVTSLVEVVIPGLAPRSARIVWQSRELLGLQFSQAIDEAEFAALLARAQ